MSGALWIVRLPAAGEGYAGDSLQVGEELNFVPGAEERGDGVALSVADFEG
jgi:hypothetical protein